MLNNTIISGRLTKDPELKHVTENQLVADKAYFSGHSKRIDEAVAESEAEDYSA